IGVVLWVLSLVPFIYYAPNWHKLHINYTDTANTTTLNTTADTLYIKALKSSHSRLSLQDDHITNTAGIHLKIRQDSSALKLKIHKKIHFFSRAEKNEDSIQYNYKVRGDTLYLAPYSISSFKQTDDNYQRVALTLFLP